jgi:hypothetical protein
MKKTLITMTALAAAAAAAACDATSAPSELDRARVLAVQIAPPRLGPEESAATEVLVGRADGTVSVVAPDSIEVTGAPPGSPASGMVTRGPDGWSIACPDAEALAAMRAAMDLPDEEPIPVALAVEVEVDGELLPASKYIFLGTEGDNPQLAGITAEGAREEDGVLVAAAGDEIAIAADGAAGEGELSYAWFTALGDIDLYLSEAATLTADEPGTGPLVLVVRDQQGGVTWAWREVRIE